jgi:Xaa-Pro aminopeptidase
VPDVLIYADTVRSAELRHEVPLGIGDAFLYVERNGTRHVAVSSLEAPRLQGLGFEVHSLEEYGLDELRRSGKSWLEIDEELTLRAVSAIGVTKAIVPATFPITRSSVTGGASRTRPSSQESVARRLRPRPGWRQRVTSCGALRPTAARH